MAVMTATEFEIFVDKMIEEINEGLPDVARQFSSEAGRGAITYFYKDADDPEERRMGLGYTKAEALPAHTYLRKLIEEYDPKTELVILATMDEVLVVRHLKFSELSQ